MIVNCLVFLCGEVQCSMGVGEGCHLFFLFPLALETHFNCRANPSAVGLLLDEAGFLTVIQETGYRHRQQL